MEDEIALNPSFKNENLDKTRHLGGEAAVGYAFAEVARAGARYSYARATFRDGDDKGNEVPLVANHQASGEIDLQLPYGLSITTTASYVSEAYQGGDTANTADKVPDYTLLGASVTYRPEFVPGDLELFVGLENLLDVDYVSWIYFGGYYPQPGFNWTVGGSYRY
jgi:iron complex outermembrane receptor protein